MIFYIVMDSFFKFFSGKLHDTVLDWENDLPDIDFNLAIEHSR